MRWRKHISDALSVHSLHSAIGYVTPADKRAGRERVIFAERDRKLDAARQRKECRPRSESDHRLTLAEEVIACFV